jgi:Mg2+ and Co2+ transporter CorA
MVLFKKTRLKLSTGKTGTNRFNKNIQKISSRTQEIYDDKNIDSVTAIKDIKLKKKWATNQRKNTINAIKKLNTYKTQLESILNELNEKVHYIQRLLSKELSNTKKSIQETKEYKIYVELKRRTDILTNKINSINNNVLALKKLLSREFPKERKKK